MNRRLLVLACFVAIVSPSSSFAQEPSESDLNEAKAEYDKGVWYFQAEEYELALPRFQRAYELSGKRPSTIINLAQTERLLGMYDEALAHYREYLEVEPNAEDRAEVEETIALVEELARRSREQDQPEPEPEPEPQPQPETAATSDPAPAETVVTTPREEEESIVENPIFWVGAGAVVVGVVVLAVVLSSGGDDPYAGTTGVTIGGIRF